MKKVLLLVCFVGLLSLHASDLDIFKGLGGSLNIAGGTAHVECEKEVVKKIMQAYPAINITIAGGGSGVGIKQVSEGLIDIANSGRAPKAEEVHRANLKSFVFAIDGIGIVVNPKSPLSNLITTQLIDIFSGKVKTFEELGFKGGEINLYVRDSSSGTQDVFVEKGINKGVISDKAKVVASNASMKTAIANDLNAIGFVSLGVADDSVKLLCIDDVCPTIDNVVNGKYKVSRGLYLITKGEPKPLAKAFIDYLQSPKGADIVKKHGFIAPKK
ncbi:MAG: phosphate ABC transporter substrate-binding protein [Sulfurospirillaceae bacterium]|nr:phosphate ABC transporter substrate-binding protein [Sulfurospirillaceae bacterium]MDD3462063.1 phosphate ABC transporter substrate-binding protein [Sulfurospirillaceae bacterium]